MSSPTRTSRFMIVDENPEALTLFILAGPDCTRCIEEFETVLDTTTSGTAHHEEAGDMQT